jgi:DNA-binding GntR family transcriptional regulator
MTKRLSTAKSGKSAGAKRSSRRAEQIFNRLVTEIVAGAIPAGLPMREAKMARQWGVSRTPMREAVRRVAEFGLLTLRHNRAPLVRAFTAREAEGLYKMREVLELLAFKEAWDHIPPRLIRDLRRRARRILNLKSDDRIDACLLLDENLHRAWIDHCQNPWLTQSLQRIWTYICIFQRFMARDPELVRQSYEDHCRILKTLGAAGPQAGLNALRLHIRRSGAAVRAVVAAR